jgi:hypothetical protein
MNRSAFVTVLTAVSLAVGPLACRDSAMPQGSGGSPKDEVIVLTDDGGTTDCHVAGKKAQLHRDHGQALHIRVMNGCQVSATVALDFGQGTNPLRPYNAVVVDSLDTGKLNLTILNDAAKGTYPFKYLVNGKPQADPDIVIDN